MLTSMTEIFEESFNRYANREEGVTERDIFNIDNTMNWEHWGDFMVGVPAVRTTLTIVID